MANKSYHELTEEEWKIVEKNCRRRRVKVDRRQTIASPLTEFFEY